MATTTAMFCLHKRLRTACKECTPTLAPPSALRDDDGEFVRPRRR